MGVCGRGRGCLRPKNRAKGTGLHPEVAAPRLPNELRKGRQYARMPRALQGWRPPTQPQTQDTTADPPRETTLDPHYLGKMQPASAGGQGRRGALEKGLEAAVPAQASRPSQRGARPPFAAECSQGGGARRPTPRGAELDGVDEDGSSRPSPPGRSWWEAWWSQAARLGAHGAAGGCRGEGGRRPQFRSPVLTLASW